ncbi:GIY-YIG nuclease family protein [Priestia megaterium]
MAETQATQESKKFYGDGIFGGVYRIENKVTGEFYIGASKYVPDNRLQSHSFDGKRSTTKLAKSIKEHGKEAFKTETIVTAKSERELAISEFLHFLEAKMANPAKCLNSDGKFRFYKDTSASFKGAKNPNAKLTEEQAVIIARIAEFKHGQQTQLVKVLDIETIIPIHSIIKGKSWQEAIGKASKLPPITFEEAITLLEGK